MGIWWLQFGTEDVGTWWLQFGTEDVGPRGYLVELYL